MERSKIAKKLRADSTNVEKLLWYRLRAKQINGLKFRRQEPIGKYIVDFVCLEKRVIIELDGGRHLLQEKRDKKRDQWLEEEGYQVLRFWDNEFYSYRESILEKIAITCTGSPSP